MAMRLYGSKLSTCTQRVMLVLNELDLSYELISIDMKRGEHKTPDFIRDVHPFGKLPAFEDGSLHIFESRAICRYLVAKYASPDSVMPPPTKLEEIARFEQVASVESSYFDTSIFKIAYEKMFKQFFGLGEADTAEMRRSENDLKEVLDYYDQVLASQQYLTRSYHWLTCSISHGFIFFPALGSKTKFCLGRMSQSGVNDWSSERRGAKSCS
ncbi:glutathione S-transferase III [Aureobasidium pullulans]|uniref:glutathione transferase n=1 Tax=Aureobasidium pullulans TaxID=5580 RepID=A0AB74IPQ3_AURPU|nr:glutathione S-transferase III [Aureobasidium pullulans]